MPKEQAPIPSVLVFLLCDQVIQEMGTNKKSLIGLFDRAWAAQFPAAWGPFWIFAKMTDGEGEYKFRVEVVKPETEKIVGRVDTPAAQIADRLTGIDLALRIPVITFEEPGIYEFNLSSNDVWIARTALNVQLQTKESK